MLVAAGRYGVYARVQQGVVAQGCGGEMIEAAGRARSSFAPACGAPDDTSPTYTQLCGVFSLALSWQCVCLRGSSMYVCIRGALRSLNA